MGEFEELVLLAVIGLNSEAYAVAVQQRIERRAGRAASMGAVYTALNRLETKGYLTSELGTPSAERGGRRKRFYHATGAGRDAVTAMRHAREQMWQGLRYNPAAG